MPQDKFLADYSADCLAAEAAAPAAGDRAVEVPVAEAAAEVPFHSVVVVAAAAGKAPEVKVWADKDLVDKVSAAALFPAQTLRA